MILVFVLLVVVLGGTRILRIYILLLLLFSVICWVFVLTLFYDGACRCDMGAGMWWLSVGVPLG